jgi:dTDP-4-dehydrorhamnose 3,5-epimerase
MVIFADRLKIVLIIMTISETNFDGVFVMEPKVWYDERGYFFESFNESVLKTSGLLFNWVQDNEARSVKGVLRGLHYQLPQHAQTKLVRVIEGEVLDVIVDLRPQSKTFGKHLSIILSSTNFKQLLVPRGFAHGYVVLSDVALFSYKCDNYYEKTSEAGIKYDDTDLGIDWILQPDMYTVSEKDKFLPSFSNHTPYF